LLSTCWACLNPHLWADMHYIGLQGVPVEPTVAFKAQRTPTTVQT